MKTNSFPLLFISLKVCPKIKYLLFVTSSKKEHYLQKKTCKYLFKTIILIMLIRFFYESLLFFSHNISVKLNFYKKNNVWFFLPPAFISDY